MLIASGHSWTDIQNYTLRQFKAFAKAAVKRSEMERVNLINAVLLGSRGTEKAIKEQMESLKKAINGS